MSLIEFEDEDGRSWRAWTTVPGSANHVHPDYADGWVSFECDSERRRLSPIPEEWGAVPVNRLRSMLQDALAVTRRSEE